MQIQVKIIIGTIAFMLTMILMGFVALREPARLEETTNAALGRSIENGAAGFHANCATCHAEDGLGREGGTCVDAAGEEIACVGANLQTAQLVCGAQPLRLQAQGWTGTKYSYINSTIHSGRPWAGMPTWGEDFDGPLSYNHIDDLTNFILNWETEELCDTGPAIEWPTMVADLPAGDAASGEDLYRNSLGCAACHGDPAVAGSEISAPWLGDIATVGAARIDGYSNADYVYESILNINAYISPNWSLCEGADPCDINSAMNAGFGLSMDPQQMADVMAYLLGSSSFETEGAEIIYPPQ